MTAFSELGLGAPLLRALDEEGYTEPTPIQHRAIPPLLAGRDLLGIAQTGTGKTAAFALPLLERLAAAKGRPAPKCPRVLVLTPTRELAAQIHESFRVYGRHLRLTHGVIYGGVGQAPQVRMLSRGVDVLVATPGRLIDLVDQGHVHLDRLEAFVLDEADRMLDMGFIHAVRRIEKLLPQRRQTLLFSATMPVSVTGLANGLLHNPERVEVAPAATTAERIEQRVFFVEKNDKRALLAELLKDPAIDRALLFTRTKHGANRVAEQLAKTGVPADAIHGNKSQGARQRALSGFRDGRLRVLVATDIAARGIDVDGVSHVINFDLPNEPESYVHRIGRTARAGAAGVALSFCDREEKAYLGAIERITRQPINVEAEHPFHAAAIADAGKRADRGSAGAPGGGGNSRNRGGRSRGGGRGRANGGAAARAV